MPDRLKSATEPLCRQRRSSATTPATALATKNEIAQPEPFVDAEQAGNFLQLQPRRVLQLARQGKIPRISDRRWNREGLAIPSLGVSNDDATLAAAVSRAGGLLMAQRPQRGWLKKEHRKEGETWVLYYRTLRESDA